MKKVIWLRCSNEAGTDKIMEVLLNLIKEDEDMAGDIPVKIYATERGVLDLSHIYDLSEISVNVLMEIFGDDNVRLVTEEEAKENCYFLEAVERIVDSLERIADSLEMFEECLVQPGPKMGKYIRILGDITTSEY